MDKSDELRLLPLSISWYHSDVVKILHSVLDQSVSVEVVCANLSALQKRKYASASDTAGGIAVFVLNRAEKSADAKAALASVTQSVQQIEDVLSQFVADDACMLAFVTQFVSGAAGWLILMKSSFRRVLFCCTHCLNQGCPKCCWLSLQFCNLCINKMTVMSKWSRLFVFSPCNVLLCF